MLPADLAVLRQHFEWASGDQKHHGELGRIAFAVANIPGPEATVVLSQWYADLKAENQIDYLAWVLSWRADLSDAARSALLASVSPEKRWFLSSLCDGNVTHEQARWLLSQGKLNLLYRATDLVGLAARAPALPMLRQQATFHDAAWYPADVGLRRLALAGIFRIALARTEPDASN